MAATNINHLIQISNGSFNKSFLWERNIILNSFESNCGQVQINSLNNIWICIVVLDTQHRSRITIGTIVQTRWAIRQNHGSKITSIFSIILELLDIDDLIDWFSKHWWTYYYKGRKKIVYTFHFYLIMLMSKVLKNNIRKYIKMNDKRHDHQQKYDGY